jgi:hypothetical protein
LPSAQAVSVWLLAFSPAMLYAPTSRAVAGAIATGSEPRLRDGLSVLLQTTCSIGLAKRVATREPDDSKSGGKHRPDRAGSPKGSGRAYRIRARRHIHREGRAVPSPALAQAIGAGHGALAVHRDRPYRARTREMLVLPSGHGDRQLAQSHVLAKPSAQLRSNSRKLMTL